VVSYQFFFKKDTLQIDAVYRDCKTTSTVFKDTNVYAEVNVTDPPYEVTRDHKVILDAEGNVIDTEPSPNPVQPTPTPPKTPSEIPITSPDGTVWVITVTDMGKIKVEKKSS